MLEIRKLEHSDIPAALKLCGQVNWNHVAADWERCLSLNPEACLGGFYGGELAATCTLIRFGAIGWVGTFLVDESLRGKGWGKTIFQAVLEAGRQQGIECLGLDSSDAGRPIYLKHGFQMTGQGIELWTGPVAGTTESDPEVRPLWWNDWDDLLSLDMDCVKVSRERQLRMMADEVGATVRIIAESGRICAFGFSRPGRLTGTIGPVVARNSQNAVRIVGALAACRRQLDGDKPVGLAVLDNAGFKKWLVGRGFQMRRRNIRMFHPEFRDVLSGSAVVAATGLGMG